MIEPSGVFTKCAWRLIPFMALLYVVNFVDRLNVGFAALTMNRDLGFTPEIFGFGAGVFFIGYILFQVPANIILARVGTRRWIFTILAVWGLISAANAFVQEPTSFYVLRFLLGVAEAGFIPGMLYYLTLWFPQAYRARFTACFIIAGPLSGVVGGPLASLILTMDGIAGLHGWQWLFLVEGVPSALLAFAVLRLLPDGPASATWLSSAEQGVISAHLASEAAIPDRDLWRAVRDPRVLTLGIAGFGLSSGGFGIALWLPQIVQAMGFSNFAIGFIVAVPYLVSMPATILWGRSSDMRGERIWHIALPMLLAAAGFAGASIGQSDVLVLVGLSLAIAGIYAAFPPFYTLPSTFLTGAAAAGGLAVVNGIAIVGGFVAPTVIGILRQETGEYGSAMALLAFVLVCSTGIVLALGRAMARRVPANQLT